MKHNVRTLTRLCGYYQFVAGTAAAINNENYAVAAIVGGAGLPFYFGNIYAAANAANKWNVSLRKDLHNNMAITLNYSY